MRTRTAKRAFGGVCLLVCGAVAGLAMGCDRSCRANATCVAEDWESPDNTDCPEDPAEGDVAGRCGIWVSHSWGDDSRAGTQAEPVQTLARAIALAQEGPERTRRVYACGEVYAEPVALPARISLFGGFDCTDQEWTYRGKDRRATLAPLPGLVPLTLLQGDANSTEEDTSFIGDIKAQAADAVVPGGSSIAVLALDYANAEIWRSLIAAGHGADGANGGMASHNGLPADNGLPGNDGADACTAEPGPGGGAVALYCPDDSFSMGGKGGDGDETMASAGTGGAPLPAPNPQGYGAGGKAEDAAAGLKCTPGFGGAEGAHGEYGLGGLESGRITKEGYVGVNGGDGKPGLPGGGGGGGGASIGPVCGAAPHGGAGGGAGGTGGCGGRAGKGGQAGGSSIGIATRSNTVRVFNSEITAGNGGDGGDGGMAQQGGQGALPGHGGLSFNGANGVNQGCGGGIGGNGGNGGHGGGGHGGYSLVVAAAGAGGVTIDQPTTIIAHGTEGLGGLGGNSSLPGTNGKHGIAAGTAFFDL
jgi:hypothetical protein